MPYQGAGTGFRGCVVAVSQLYRDEVLEKLGAVQPVTWRAMFGGVSIYAEGRIFALMADDRLYLKVDDGNRSAFEEAGMGPFLPYGDSSRPMGYFELPPAVLADPGRLAAWVGDALAVAERAALRKRRR